MKLSSEQKQQVAEWVAAGATLNEIQDRLKSDMNVVLTFMDTRFLLSDLGLTLRPPPEEEAEAAKHDELVEGSADEWESPGSETDALPEEPGAPPQQVKVTVDAVTLPGTMVSGKVTFSDGVSGGWYLDQMGQLGLTGIPRSYQPPESDVVAFQRELQRAIK
ncbi:MAG: hypothetical protein ACKV19_07760 [Verrucomicrobiales bacterium]